MRLREGLREQMEVAHGGRWWRVHGPVRGCRAEAAEAAAVSGDLATAVSIINELHENAGIPATFTSNDAAEVLAQIVDERQRELFLESHHLADVRQYGIPLDPAPGTLYKNGLVWVGDQTCFPLPEVERVNNPNIP